MDDRVWVRRQWNDYRDALYKIDDVDGLHWRSVSGGLNLRSPRPFLMGYVWCDGMLMGELAHSCRHGRGPHKILVCIPKKTNSVEVFVELALGAEAEAVVRRARSNGRLTREQAAKIRRASVAELRATLSGRTPRQQLAELTHRAMLQSKDILERSARRGSRLVYDRNQGIGEIPENLKSRL